MSWILNSVLYATFSIVVLVLVFKQVKTRGSLHSERVKVRELTNDNHALKSKYQNILDVDAEILKRKKAFSIQKQQAIEKINVYAKKTKATIRKEKEDFETEKTASRAAIDRKLQTEKEILTTKQREADRLKNKAQLELKDAKDKKQTILEEATEHSKRIVATANTRAEEIAGDALEAKNNADHYEKAIAAMKNTIKGYGDEYLVPGYTLLDDLAEEFTHKDAGRKLKIARDHTRMLVKHESAADCAYVADLQRKNAIHFVLDAFNGKADTILTKVKKDNFGKLDQMLKDAFHLVNKNGKVFRDALITHEYLESRREELKWAVMTTELQIREREEQRQIKQEMREEEKAKREYAKAIKQAEKEEKLLQDMMKKVQDELASANEEQRHKFEQDLAELQGKLTEAEEKNQRAISMAQQTRRGHVYVISNIGSFGDDIYKIGLTRRLEPHVRVKELGDASVPFGFDVHAMMYSEDAPKLEKDLHRVFHGKQVNKVNPRKEFFRLGISDIRQVVDEIGVETKWTMAAEAREYRESLANGHVESVRIGHA